MTLELRSVGSGDYYEVCLTEEGIRECTYVSSMHLVDEKESQLRAAIRRKAFEAFIETHATDQHEI